MWGYRYAEKDMCSILHFKMDFSYTSVAVQDLNVCDMAEVVSFLPSATLLQSCKAHVFAKL
jgi:hypothetical protein